MIAHIKLKSSEKIISVENLKKIIVITSDENTVITDFQGIAFYVDVAYSFIGKTILSIWGQDIEYVEFD